MAPKRIVVAVAAALVGVLILAILNADFLVRRNKDFLIDRAQQALGQKISVDRIEIRFFPLGVRLANFAIADDPVFSTEDFFRARDLAIDLRFLPLLIGQFRPKKISFDSPIVTIIVDARGRYNFASRADNEKPGRSGEAGTKSLADQEGTHFPWAPSMSVSNGTLRYRNLTGGGELTATQIDLKVNNFDQGKSFDVQLEAAVMTTQPNLHFKSRIGPIAENSDYRDVPVAGEVNAMDLNLGKINKSVPKLRKALPQALRFDGVYTIKELKFRGTLNKLSLKGAVTGTDASFHFD